MGKIWILISLILCENYGPNKNKILIYFSKSILIKKIKWYDITWISIKEKKLMSEVKWTDEQKQAIEEKDANILVAAAARKWKNGSSCWKNY